MANNYIRWDTLTNPGLGSLTNSYVNYYEGTVVTQTIPSPTHVLPNSFVGKRFHINNDALSSEVVTVTVNIETGPEVFDIPPGDSGIFVFSGNGLWDEVGGEEVIRRSSQDVTNPVLQSAQNQIARSISFADVPDTGVGTFIIGSVPAGFGVSDVSLSISQGFTATAVDNVEIRASVSSTLIMSGDESDVLRPGNYTVEHPVITTPLNGEMVAIFNAGPNGPGATAGNLNVLIEYLEL